MSSSPQLWGRRGIGQSDRRCWRDDWSLEGADGLHWRHWRFGCRARLFARPCGGERGPSRRCGFLLDRACLAELCGSCRHCLPIGFPCSEGEGALPTGKIQTGRDDAELYLYPGAALSFAIPSGGNNDQPSAALAHSRSIALFRRVIGPHYDLVKLWEKHLSYEFETRDVEATMATMVAEPYVNHVPTMMGGVGKLKLSRFYRDHFIFSNPPDTRSVLLSRTVGADRVIDEMLHCFTHTTVVDWLLPGVPPTGRYVEIPPGRCSDLPRR
jgi:hypothetical protein